MPPTNTIQQALARLAAAIGPGVRDVSFRLELEGGAVVLSPETLPLSVSETPDGRVIFAGQWRDVSVGWEFVPQSGGYRVQLRATGRSPLTCSAMQSIIITYRPDAADLATWRVPTRSLDIGHVGMPTLGGLEDSDAPATLLRGLFPDSRGTGLLAGTVLPQRCKHTYLLRRNEDGAATLSCTTSFPAGLAGQASLQSESTWVCATRNAGDAFAAHAGLVPAMVHPPQPPVGWNSWDYYFSALWLEDIIENMEEIRRDPALSAVVQHIVVDMGWEHTWSEWYPNYRFPGGLERLAEEISSRGFTPGIWTAPLIVGTLTTTALRHSYMLVKDEHGDPMGWGGQYLIDPTHPSAQDWLREIYTRLHGAGFRLFKVDYVSALVDAQRLHDPTKGHHEALADLFRLIRECVGAESHIVGCGLPLECGPGLVDSTRTGIDIHNHWTHVTWAFDFWTLVYGLHNRIAIADPDFLVVRGSETSTEAETNVTNPQAHNPVQGRWRGGPVFTRTEAQTWASIVAMTGGSVFLSDRLGKLTDDAREMLRKAIAPTGISARPLDLCDAERASLWLQELAGERRLTVINWADEARHVRVEFARHGLLVPSAAREMWTGETLATETGALTVSLPAHGSAVLVWGRPA